MLKIAFYKNDNSFMHRMIRFLTKSPFSHCELVFSDDWCFGADPEEGTRFITYSNLYDEAIWCLMDLPWISEENEKRIHAFCEQEDDLEYDWSGVVLGRINPLHNHRSKWFCSELCVTAIRPFTKGITDFWYTPGSLYQALLDTRVFNI